MSTSETSCRWSSCLRHALWPAVVLMLAGLVGLLYLVTRPDPTVLLAIVDTSVYRTPPGLIVPDPAAWQDRSIEQVLLLVSNGPQRRERRGRQAYEEALAASGLQVHELVFPDNAQADPETFAKAVALVAVAQQQNSPMVIHCAAGMHRATAVEVMYRHLALGEPPAKLNDVMRLRGLGGCQSRIAAHLRNQIQQDTAP